MQNRRAFLGSLGFVAALTATRGLAAPPASDWRKSKSTKERMLGITLELRAFIRKEFDLARKEGKKLIFMYGDTYRDKADYFLQVVSAITLSELQKEVDPRNGVDLVMESATDSETRTSFDEYFGYEAVKQVVENADAMIAANDDNADVVGMVMLAKFMRDEDLAKELLLLDSVELAPEPNNKLYAVPGAKPSDPAQIVDAETIRDVVEKSLPVTPLERNGFRKMDANILPGSSNIPFVIVGQAHLKAFSEKYSSDNGFRAVAVSCKDGVQQVIRECTLKEKTVLAYELVEPASPAASGPAVRVGKKKYMLGEQVVVDTSAYLEKYKFLASGHVFDTKTGLDITMKYENLAIAAQQCCAQAQEMEQARKGK